MDGRSAPGVAHRTGRVLARGQPRAEAGGGGGSTTPLDGLDCVLAANPPIDLAVCCRTIQQPENRIYDRNFVQQLRREVARLHAAFPDLGP